MSNCARPVLNDPWIPLPSNGGAIQQPPADPRHQLIDSCRYIESLEKRLGHIKGRQKAEPTSRDIIDTLAVFKEDQMRHFMEKERVATLCTQDEDSSLAASYIQRKLYPERQALNVEELFELLKDDELERAREEDRLEKSSVDKSCEETVDS